MPAGAAYINLLDRVPQFYWDTPYDVSGPPARSRPYGWTGTQGGLCVERAGWRRCGCRHTAGRRTRRSAGTLDVVCLDSPRLPVAMNARCDRGAVLIGPTGAEGGPGVLHARVATGQRAHPGRRQGVAAAGQPLTDLPGAHQCGVWRQHHCCRRVAPAKERLSARHR